jgi:hypothetical protein
MSRRNFKVSAFFNIFMTVALATVLTVISGCATVPPVKQQAYAALPQERTYENEFAVVWKGLEEVLRNSKVVERSPETVDALEWRKITERKLETDWIYSQSRDKYQEYSIRGVPKRQALQIRYRFFVMAKKRMGGVDLVVKTEEELESLSDDGTPRGYATVEADPSRGSELLEKVYQAILAAPPTGSLPTK